MLRAAGFGLASALATRGWADVSDVPVADLALVMTAVPALRFPGWPWVLAALAAPVVGWSAWLAGRLVGAAGWSARLCRGAGCRRRPRT